MLSNHITKIVQNLEKKKFREKYNLFKVEGRKLVEELFLSSIDIQYVIAQESWLVNKVKLDTETQLYIVNEQEMKKISNFQSLPDVIAVAKIPNFSDKSVCDFEDLVLALNGIQDPGNMGTILRIADWFGIKQIFCDNGCADIYNPKVIQASMGAVFRLIPQYMDLYELIQNAKGNNAHIYGTFLDGANIYAESLCAKGVVVMGNEGQGISEEIESLVTQRLTIPSFSQGATSESLNVGVATGIVLSEFKRRNVKK